MENYISEVLTQKKNNPGQTLDLSKIPVEKLDEVFDAIHALFRFDNGLQINQQLTQALSEDALEGLKLLQKEFSDALIAGRATFQRNGSGRVGSSMGLDR